MLADVIALSLAAAGLPVCFARLWWIWWQAQCVECGLQHRVCTCGPGDHMMRPRR